MENKEVKVLVEQYRKLILDTCTSGQTADLKQLLAEKGVDCVRKLLENLTERGSTALILACKYGHLDLVKMMVEECDAELSQSGKVMFDGEIIDDTPPLWCASAAGHLEIVRFLVNKGAQVNRTTVTNSTALRAACFDGHLKVVQYLVEHKADIEIANRHGHTCLMIACYRGHTPVVKYLISQKARINRQSAKGNTALHDSAESGKLEILKLLLRAGAHLTEDSYGQTPLSAAAMTGHHNIVDFLVSTTFFPGDDEANAWELLGATYVDKKHDHGTAYRLWLQALEVRQKLKCRKLSCVEAKAIYNNAKEFKTVQQCEDMRHDPDLTRMQALLIRERILGPAHPETTFCIRFRGALYADGGDFDRCSQLWLYTIQTQTSSLDTLSEATISSFLSFVELFSYVFIKGTDKVDADQREGFVETVLKVLEIGVKEAGRYRAFVEEGDRESVERDVDVKKLLVCLLHIVSLVDHVPSLSLPPRALCLRKALYRLQKMHIRTRDRASLLHLACDQGSTDYLGRIRVSDFPQRGVARVLMDVGADPNLTDACRRTPLHLACQGPDVDVPLVQALITGGAHADVCDHQHVSPLDQLRELGAGWGRGVGRDVCPVANTTLKCLAARAIAHNPQLLPPESYLGTLGHPLETFIALH